MKKMMLTTLALFAVAAVTMARDGFAIVIDPKSYDQARTEVDAYARAIEEVHGLKVFTVIDRWGVPDSIRQELQRLHQQKQDPIVGAVFIGDIPVPMVRDGQHMTSAFKMNQTQPRKESSVPSDRFYDDFGLQFRYLDKDADAPYFYYSIAPEGSQRTHPDIYSGRIRPTDIGGTTRYEKLRAYLNKATAAKRQARSVNQLFFFSGHGYISESKVARQDEKPAFTEHFPSLLGNTNHFSFMDHSDHNPIKEHLMNELMRTDLDVAVLHHHGSWDTEYLSEVRRPYMVKDAKTYIERNIRQHIYSAHERGRNVDSVMAVLLKRFDVPESWAKDALSDSLAREDSIYDAVSDMHLEDFAIYGYQPNTPVIILDACFNGSFHRDDCIANEYIFQPGQTVAVLANSVNSLQDKWSDRFIGLLDEGGCIGDMARFSTYLESHVIGDPTYRFASVANAADIDHLISFGKVADWKKVLKKGTPEQQALAIEMLHQHEAISSSELLGIFKSSPYGIVRLQTLRSIVDFADDNTITLLQLASQDSFELLQRLAVRYYGESGDDRLIPQLITLAIANNTSDRVTFDVTQAIPSFPKEKLLAEFERQFNAPTVRYIRKDSVHHVIEKAIAYNADKTAKDLEATLKADADAKERRFAIRATRNTAVHHLIPQMLDFAQSAADEDTKLLIIEALGWHPLSYQASLISEAMQKIQQDPKYSQAVRDEALKTQNRIHAK
ncbi:MAG: HEAT repeat domain-containing protein [Prevotella sp.]|nr:HEAT repeat domain-containing protein [Prevotella sp.]